MEPFEERLIIEKQELDQRITKLRSFLESNKPAALDPDDLTLLRNQYHAMSVYTGILEERIKRLGINAGTVSLS